MKIILVIITVLAIAVYGLLSLRFNQSPKHYSKDGQYSFYSKRSLFGASFFSAPGDGDTGGGTIYVYDERDQKVIYQFESSWIRADMEASGFGKVDGGMFICKSGYNFELPRPLNTSIQMD